MSMVRKSNVNNLSNPPSDFDWYSNALPTEPSSQRISTISGGLVSSSALVVMSSSPYSHQGLSPLFYSQHCDWVRLEWVRIPLQSKFSDFDCSPSPGVILTSEFVLLDITSSSVFRNLVLIMFSCTLVMFTGV